MERHLRFARACAIAAGVAKFDGGSAEYSLPQSWGHEVCRLDRGGWTDGATSFTASRLGGWGFERGWSSGCGGDRDQCTRGDLDEPEPGQNHWIEFKLQGTKSNRDGIGARIKVVTKSGAQYNHMTTSAGYASSSAGPVHFGLGGHASADLVEIRWPSGIVQQMRDVAGDRVVVVKEPAH